MRNLIIYLLLGGLFCVSAVANTEEFTISEIELVGARRITLATVISYLPVSVGETVDAAGLQTVLRELYRTEFFSDIRLLRRGNVLVIRVNERPAIAEINIEGNKKVKDDDINKAFEEVGLARGRIFNDSVLSTMRQELQQLYYSAGRYGVNMQANVTTLPRHRVKIDIDIKEGRPSKIKQINIVGNTVFSNKILLKQIKSGIPKWWQIFSSKDEYSDKTLSGDFEALESYYQDQGYINFSIDSTQITITPDRKDIYITVNVTEGEVHTYRDTKVTGEMVLEESFFHNIANNAAPKGQAFSRKQLNDAKEYIENVLGNFGYAFAEVRILPTIDDQTQEVDITLNIDPKQKIYVNRIIFNGNEKTFSEVYLREMRQMEGAAYNDAQVERSRVRVQRLPYVEEVSVDKQLTPGYSDRVDVVYDIEERLSGSFNVSAGVSDDKGVAFALGVTQSNLFGTGNALSLSVSSSDVVKNLSATYTNPYYTNDGISRSITGFFREFDTSERSVSSDFILNTLGFGVSYGMPLTEYSRLDYGLTIGSNEIKRTAFTPNIISTFLENNGVENDFLKLNLGYAIDTRDRRVFARRGSLNSITYNLNVPGSDLEYYKLSYLGEFYLPVTKRTSLLFKVDLGLGEGLGKLNELPFYEKFLAGGVRSLRGFEARSIGPQVRDFAQPDSPDISDDSPYGGDVKTIGSIAWLLPVPGAGNSARISLFYDFGNVYTNADEFSTSNFRSSIGVAIQWLSPLGPLIFSLADQIDKQAGDETEDFQFTLGTAF